MPRPFNTGSQYSDWTERNCAGYIWSREFGGTCSIETSLLEAYVGDGEVGQDIIDRMGFVKTNPPRYNWRCLEFQEEA